MAGDENIMFAALSSTYLGGGEIGLSYHLGKSCSSFSVVSGLLFVAEGLVHLAPAWLGRMKMGMDPDMTEDSQAEAVESPSLLRMGLRTGRQALMTPRRASRQVNRARREYMYWALVPLFHYVSFGVSIAFTAQEPDHRTRLWREAPFASPNVF